ncbi:helix-turn-helix domain-containing protein [Yinghuangia soli]|uniref:Helix-turn-helix transcriptional regulator n=1 Tax=Yinghuangia soli TaxID=2908204 RepID=A0AA41TW99_9ACTN|nr:helix-turn-helix transcriptional regulator [Yinghuangia soli]MCF2525613.1 helix-turn-helix transcriptional regulator [Yinghuangia soli]
MREIDPTSPRGLYGAELRRLRLAAKLSLDALATKLHRGKTFVSEIESGATAVPPGLSEQLDAYFGTDTFTRWYPAVKRDMHPDRYQRFMELEPKAEILEEYAAHVVPGLLQTAEYAHALITNGSPDATPDEVETRVRIRLERQERLKAADRPRYWAVLDEAVIRRPIGGHAVMATQLRALLAAVADRTVTVQVIPFEVGAHPAMGGSLTLLTLPDRSLVAYLEGIKSGDLIEDPETAAEYERTYDVLRAVAVSPEASADMIRAAAEEFAHDSHHPRPERPEVA